MGGGGEALEDGDWGPEVWYIIRAGESDLKIKIRSISQGGHWVKSHIADGNKNTAELCWCV